MASSTTQPPSTARRPLSDVLPPLIFGTATFNYQYNVNPYALDPNDLVRKAMEYGVRAFDTSPYYGPSEEILGTALSQPAIRDTYRRDEYFLLTKVGRIASEEFDYSPEWVSTSVERSLQRLRTTYLDTVYCHDVEFVSPAEVLAAVRELRRIRDTTGAVRYVGISGYPVPVLTSLAQMILRETGEPLDIVMSYANFTLQNQTLATKGIEGLRAAGVDVVPNASPLAMGLLRQNGVPQGGMGDWHPAGNGLRAAVARAADFCDRYGERLEVVAIRWALETWLTTGAVVGARGDPASGVPFVTTPHHTSSARLGVSVMGVSTQAELDKTMQVWRSILDGREDGEELARRAGRWARDHEWSVCRARTVQILGDGIREHLDEYLEYAWPSPNVGFVNKHPSAKKFAEEKEKEKEQSRLSPPFDAAIDLPTPAASPAPQEVVKPILGEEQHTSTSGDLPIR